MRRRADLDSDNTDRWLLTYADLITLLLAFFVLMYAISKVDSKKFEKITQRLSGEFNAGDERRRATEESEFGAGALKVGQLKLIAQRLQSPSVGPVKRRVNIGASSNIAQSSGFDSDPLADSLTKQISVELNERGLVIHVLESALFASGSATLRTEAQSLMDRIAGEIRELPNQIRVEGHTDDRPIATSRFPSNWELSTARAAAVVRYFIEKHQLPPDQISALGFGEHRPLVANDTDENRGKNRRVDIVILTENLSRFEPKANASSLSSTGNILPPVSEESSATP